MVPESTLSFGFERILRHSGFRRSSSPERSGVIIFLFKRFYRQVLVVLLMELPAEV